MATMKAERNGQNGRLLVPSRATAGPANVFSTRHGLQQKKLGYYITAKGEIRVLVGDEPAAGIILISIKEKSEKPF